MLREYDPQSFVGPGRKKVKGLLSVSLMILVGAICASLWISGSFYRLKSSRGNSSSGSKECSQDVRSEVNGHGSSYPKKAPSSETGGKEKSSSPGLPKNPEVSRSPPKKIKNTSSGLTPLDDTGSDVKVLFSRPSHIEPFLSMANRTLRAGSLSRAIRTYKEILRVDPDQKDANLGLAIALGMAGDWGEARKRLERLCNTHPTYAISWLNLGISDIHVGNYKDAIRVLDRAASLGADPCLVYLNKGIALRHLGDLSKAIASYRKAQLYCPNNAELTWNLAIALDAAGSYREAISFYEAILRKGIMSVSDAELIRYRLSQLRAYMSRKKPQ